MLRATEHDESGGWRLELEGRLAGDWTKEAERLWASAPIGKPRLVDLRGVTCADVDGRDLLHRMHREGARFVTGGVVMQALVEELRSDRFESAAMVVKVIGAALLAMFASTSNALAQTSTPPPPQTSTQAAASTSPAGAPLRLTLQQAVSMGLRQSPEVAIANLNLAAVQEHRKRGQHEPRQGDERHLGAERRDGLGGEDRSHHRVAQRSPLGRWRGGGRGRRFGAGLCHGYRPSL